MAEPIARRTLGVWSRQPAAATNIPGWNKLVVVCATAAQRRAPAMAIGIVATPFPSILSGFPWSGYPSWFRFHLCPRPLVESAFNFIPFQREVGGCLVNFVTADRSNRPSTCLHFAPCAHCTLERKAWTWPSRYRLKRQWDRCRSN